MKKLLIVLLALTVLGGFAIAQDAPKLAFAGAIETGFVLSADKDGAAFAQQYESNWPSNGIGYFDASIATAKSGAFAEILVNDSTSIGQDALYAWWKPVEMVKVLIGYGVGSYYATPIEGWKTSTNGIQVRLDPIPGLQVSAEYQQLAGPTGLATSNISFDGSYEMADMFKVGFDYNTAGEISQFGLDVKAVPNLVLQFDGRYSAKIGALVTDWNGTNDTTLQMEQEIIYTMGAMKPQLWAQETNTTDLAYDIQPAFAYVMDGWTPKVYFDYMNSVAGDKTWDLGLQADATVEQVALRGVAQYNSDSSWKLSARFIVSF